MSYERLVALKIDGPSIPTEIFSFINLINLDNLKILFKFVSFSVQITWIFSLLNCYEKHSLHFTKCNGISRFTLFKQTKFYSGLFLQNRYCRNYQFCRRNRIMVSSVYQTFVWQPLPWLVAKICRTLVCQPMLKP